MNDVNPSAAAAGSEDSQAQAQAAAQAADGPDAALAAAEAKAQDNRNQYLRAVAELENYRKRTEREIDNARKFAVERFAQDLVNVGDALEAGIVAGAAAGATAGAGATPGAPNSGAVVLEGAQATLRQLQKAFEKAGIKVIDPAGQAFDPEWHEAMVAQESRDKPANTVLTVIQKGYSLNGRLLRPARVIVSKSPGDGN